MRATGGRRRAVKQYLLQQLRAKAPLSESEARLVIRRLAESDYRVENWVTERRIVVLLKILEKEGRLKGRLKLR
ncbi:MAG: hypothetical protein QW407_04125 [Thermofilaceae archaeon]